LLVVPLAGVHANRMMSVPLGPGMLWRDSDSSRRKGPELLADSYPFLNLVWTMFVFFAFVIWVALVIMVMIDNFKRTDHSGLAKAGWTVFVIFLPLIGVLVYMIARPSEQLMQA
jgi:hypothetical protein